MVDDTPCPAASTIKIGLLKTNVFDGSGGRKDAASAASIPDYGHLRAGSKLLQALEIDRTWACFLTAVDGAK
jgi:hypothetical protein